MSRKQTKFLHMVAAIISTAFLEDLSRTLQEPPFDFRRVPWCCRVSSPTPPALPVTKTTRDIRLSSVTASRPASSQKFYVSARNLLMFAASLSVPLPEPHQLAHSISPCTPKEQLDRSLSPSRPADESAWSANSLFSATPREEATASVSLPPS